MPILPNQDSKTEKHPVVQQPGPGSKFPCGRTERECDDYYRYNEPYYYESSMSPFEDALAEVGWALLIVVGAVGGAIFGLVGLYTGEYGIQLAIGIWVPTVIGGGSALIALVVLIVYGICWALEEADAIEDNPIDIFYHQYLASWYESLSNIDWIRMILIYLEYQVTLMLGANEFDPKNAEFQNLFNFFVYPFIWNLILVINPFLFLLMPIVMIIYWSDPSLFEQEVLIFMNSADETNIKVDEDGNIMRLKKRIKVAKPGVPTLIGKIYQLQRYMWGDFEFMTNNDYLEMRERILISVTSMPYLSYQYSGLYEIVMIPWMNLSLVVFLIQLIVGEIESAAIESRNPDDPMTWTNFLERHVTHYEY